ncbi:peptidoglycan-associated lipoprotein Pal [Candidatus Sumerlaeota bacterium]|nr:peptidoglycan-associated lipoprotein Pal [Candidatus Sumerlaeota bacterium]
MRRFFPPLLLILCAILVVSSVGCSRRKPSPPISEIVPPGLGDAGETGDDIGSAPEGRRIPISDAELATSLQTVYFDYDRSEIRFDQMDQLERNAQCLVENPDVTVLIEGHCDERGTVEYNFALGERRAESVRDFLVSRGVKAANLDVISKGEEEPMAFGHDEESWTQNRRAEFKITR